MALVTVEGLITSVQRQKKDDKVSTLILLAQKGEREQIAVKLPGDQTAIYSELELNKFSGRLMLWKTRDGVGSMVLVQDEE